MGLKLNAFGTMRVLGGAYADRFFRDNLRRMRLGENAGAFGQYTSFPQGYQDVSKSYIPSFRLTDFIRAQISGSSDLINIGITVPMNMSATVSGEGFLTPDAEVGKTLGATLTGVGNLSGDSRNIVSMRATIDAGARPSAFDIAQEVWLSQAAGFPNPTTMGGKVNAAGTAGDPWGADLSSYPPGTAGNMLYSLDPQQLADAIMNDPRLLTVAKFLGLK